MKAVKRCGMLVIVCGGALLLCAGPGPRQLPVARVVHVRLLAGDGILPPPVLHVAVRSEG